MVPLKSLLSHRRLADDYSGSKISSTDRARRAAESSTTLSDGFTLFERVFLFVAKHQTNLGWVGAN